jgi:hypothetical protein
LTFSLNFKEEAISNIEIDYIKVKVLPGQMKLISEISKLISNHIEIPIIALRGIVWKALEEWQVKNNEAIDEIVNMKSSERLIAVKQIFNFCKDCMKRLLYSPKTEEEAFIDIIYEKVFKYYIDNLNRLNQ